MAAAIDSSDGPMDTKLIEAAINKAMMAGAVQAPLFPIYRRSMT